MTASRRRTSVMCIDCRTVLTIPPGIGLGIQWVRAQGWATCGNGMSESRCERCRNGSRLGPKPKEPTETDLEYRRRLEAREAADRELLRLIAEQHEASKPVQPLVERAMQASERGIVGPGKYG